MSPTLGFALGSSVEVSEQRISDSNYGGGVTSSVGTVGRSVPDPDTLEGVDVREPRSPKHD